MAHYFNPVKIIYSDNWLHELKICIQDLNITNPLIISSYGNRKRLNLNLSFNSSSIFSDIDSNPNFDDCDNAIQYCFGKHYDGVIALGGGSVMDLAKVVRAHLSIEETNVINLIQYKGKYQKSIPSIFLPTTHGTASEVTMWGTIWNMKEKRKYSISHPELYPNRAILDGNLTLSLPMDISIITTLDALSHSFESLWNKNANSISTKYAILAICLILENCSQLKKTPNDLTIRNNLLKASTIAGLAFSNTKTAAAHSMSYPLTIHYGIPHGIASSISLIPLLEKNRDFIQGPLDKICTLLNLTLKELIEEIKEIPLDIIPFSLSEWGIQECDLPSLVNESFTKGRMDNNVVNLTKKDVQHILMNIY